MLLSEGKHVIVQDKSCMVGEPARAQVDFIHLLEFARIKGVLTEQVTGTLFST